MSKAKHSHLIRLHRARRRTARKAAFVMRMRIVRLVRELPMYRSTPRARHTRESALLAVPAMLARWVRHCERHRIMIGDQPARSARWFAKEVRRYAGLS